MGTNIDEIDELKAKIALLEGDRKAFLEASKWTMKQNEENITGTRKENKDLRKKLKDCLSADSHVINQAFQNKPVERAALKNRTGEQAITRMDHKICDQEKRLNKLRHDRVSRQKRLEELQTQYAQMMKDSEENEIKDKGEGDEAERMRNIENRLDKAQLKLQEAEHISRTYGQIKHKLEEEAMSYPSRLNNLEKELRRTRASLEEVRQVSKDANISRESAQTQLHKFEEKVYAERKRREQELHGLKKDAEERRQHQEKIERRIQRHASFSGEDGGAGSGDRRGLDDTEREKITSYEEAFQRIKEATGVADIQEVVDRFESQGDTRRHLEELKRENEKQIDKLKEEKDRLTKDFENKKYTGEAKLSQGQRLLEKFEAYVKSERDRLIDSENRLEKLSQLLVDTRSGVEHLHEKLQHIKTTRSGFGGAKISAATDEYVLDLLSVCEEKLLRLLEELETENEDELQKSMVDEEFQSSLEGRLPVYNVRIKLGDGKDKADQLYEEDEQSADEGAGGGDVLSRAALKKQAQALIDAKNKRGGGKASKKKKKR